MVKTSARLLHLLSLLQVQRRWTGPELADRLGVTSRTVRADIDRLRGLGYPIDASPGSSGGYRLAAGTAMPPLLLDDDEAVAVVVGLRTAAGGSVAGIEETSVRALAKLEQVLPSRLRNRVDALHAATVAIPGVGPTVAAETLVAVATAIRAQERLRFGYANHDREPSHREVEPHRLVSSGRRWYLIAWDPERADWRTFRVDRMSLKTPGGSRFTPRALPDGDVGSYLQRGTGTAVWRYLARVIVHAPADEVRAKLPLPIEVEEIATGRSMIEVGSDTPQMLALYLGLLDVDFDVVDSPELAGHLATLSDRFRRAADPHPVAP